MAAKASFFPYAAAPAGAQPPLKNEAAALRKTSLIRPSVTRRQQHSMTLGPSRGAGRRADQSASRAAAPTVHATRVALAPCGNSPIRRRGHCERCASADAAAASRAQSADAALRSAAPSSREVEKARSARPTWPRSARATADERPAQDMRPAGQSAARRPFSVLRAPARLVGT